MNSCRTVFCLRQKTSGQFPGCPKPAATGWLREGKDLFDWHPLVSGDPDSVHRAGMSIRGKVTAFEDDLADTDDYLLHLLKREP